LLPYVVASSFELAKSILEGVKPNMSKVYILESRAWGTEHWYKMTQLEPCVGDIEARKKVEQKKKQQPMFEWRVGIYERVGVLDAPQG
jgi:hypothetical protein